MKKKLIALIATLMVASTGAQNAYAVTTAVTPSTGVETVSESEENSTEIKLHLITTTVPYSADEINVTYNYTDEEVQAIITSIETGEILETIGEEITNEKARGTYQSRVYREHKKGPCTSRLYALLELYSYNNYRQINKVLDTYWAEASSGDWKLEREKSSGYIADKTSAGVGTKASVNGTANIVITTTKSTGGEFSLSSLKGYGYAVSHSTGSTYYARTSIDKSYTYSLY